MNTFSREMSIDKLVSELIRVHKENIETWRSEEKRVDRLKAGSQYFVCIWRELRGRRVDGAILINN